MYNLAYNNDLVRCCTRGKRNDEGGIEENGGDAGGLRDELCDLGNDE